MADMICHKVYELLMSILNITLLFIRTLTTACCEVWNVFGETQSKRLQKLQNRAAIIILNISNDVDYTIALRTLGWEPLQTERKKTKARMMYKLFTVLV